MRLPETPVSSRPDNFWNWRALDIDEARWEEDESVRRQESDPYLVWWFVGGGLVGLLLTLLS